MTGDGRTIILRLTFALKTVDAIHVIGFMVATIYEE